MYHIFPGHPYTYTTSLECSSESTKHPRGRSYIARNSYARRGSNIEKVQVYPPPHVAKVQSKLDI